MLHSVKKIKVSFLADTGEHFPKYRTVTSHITKFRKSWDINGDQDLRGSKYPLNFNWVFSSFYDDCNSVI